MRILQKAILCFSATIFLCANTVTAQNCSIEPVTKNASPEIRALLKFFYSISGEYLLQGNTTFLISREKILNLPQNT